MRSKENRKLRKVGERHMLVDVSGKESNIADVYTFNDTAAFIWEILSVRNADEKELASELSNAYDVGYAAALADVRQLVGIWLESGLIAE